MTDAPKIVYDALAQAQKPWTVGFARFLSRVERGFADAVEPLGLRADRRIGLKTRGLSFQPAIAIMPVEPADFGAEYHADYVGAVFLQHETRDLSYAFARKSLTGSSCRFAALVHVNEVRVDIWLPGDDKPTSYLAESTIRVDDIVVKVDDLYAQVGTRGF